MMTNLVLIGSVVLGFIILLISTFAFLSRNYIRIAPNKAAVLYGRKNKSADGAVKGYRLITGGGVLKIPFFEQVAFMDLSNRVINIEVMNAPNKDGVMTTVEGIANVKFASDKTLLMTAVERFLGKDETEVNKIIYQNLEGHLRSVVGKMTIESLINDKQAFNKAVLEDATEDFQKMGINIDFLNIQNVKDNDNYIINLGKRRAAEIKRDAEIGTAEANRDSIIKTTTANRKGVEEANLNEVAIAESGRNRDVKKAEFKVNIDTQNEVANQAGPLSKAQALKAVVEAQAFTEAAQQTAQAKVEEARALKESMRYKAEVIVPADAQKQAVVIQSEASKQQQILIAEGSKGAVIAKAEGDAEAIKLTFNAKAQGEAAVIKQQGLAEADVIKAKLVAQAEGTAELAEAYAKLDQTGKFLEVLKALQTLGPNMIKEFAGVMAASTAHLANIKDVKIIDFGGQNGGSTTGKFGSVPVEIITKMFEGLTGTGFDMSKLKSFFGDKSNTEVAVVEEKPITKK